MSSSPSIKIYCSIRKEWVQALPEEKVRQQLILRMITYLGYPEALIAVEKSLRQMPHLTSIKGKLPERRADILCYGKDIHSAHSLYPLLLIECKAILLSKKVVQQVVGYNHYVKACFIAIANEQEVRTGWYDKEEGKYVFVPRLPTYDQLLKALT